jgi:hypothetical protein
MTGRTKITTSLAILVVAAAAGGSAWGAIAAGEPDPNQPIPVDLPEFPIGGLIPPDADAPEMIDPLA